MRSGQQSERTENGSFIRDVPSSRTGQSASSDNNGGTPLTKNGNPDRRFQGQRDLPPPEENQDYTPARTGGVENGMHVTVEGKPDKRFAENRALSDEEVKEKWGENLQAEAQGAAGGSQQGNQANAVPAQQSNQKK